MASQALPLHILFFPFMSPSHILSMLDMARLFAARGVKATILTTPANARTIQLSIKRTNEAGQCRPIQIVQIPFPSTAHGLPEGCESLSSLPNQDMKVNFLEATFDLRQPFDGVLRDLRPDCVVTNTFLPWTYEVAAELGIPRLVFHGMSLFAICARMAVDERKPHENVPSSSESFVVPGLPHRIEMHRSNMPKLTGTIPPVYLKMFAQLKEFEPKSYGLVANTFHELEPDYVEHYRKVLGGKVWNLGPVSLCNRDIVDKSERGNESSADGDACLKWLDGKSPGSVVYVCFGGINEFSRYQLREISLGLEASNHPFIWVVRKRAGEDWIQEGFEKRAEGRGLVIGGWAPQILILNHESVGGFVTHCGWNSSLEGISAGLPLVTWPLFAEQFYNERLIVDVLKVGVPIGSKLFRMKAEDEELIAAAAIEEAVNRLMDGGEEATERRRMAKAIGEMAAKAMEKDGSSYNDMSHLIQDLMDRRVAAAKRIV